MSIPSTGKSRKLAGQGEFIPCAKLHCGCCVDRCRDTPSTETHMSEKSPTRRSEPVYLFVRPVPFSSITGHSKPINGPIAIHFGIVSHWEAGTLTSTCRSASLDAE